MWRQPALNSILEHERSPGGSRAGGGSSARRRQPSAVDPGPQPAKLFDPLEIDTRPAFANQLPDTNAEKFADAGFGWGTDPQGIAVGAFGLRLRATDLLKLGGLYVNNGVWHGKQILPEQWEEQAYPSDLNPQRG